MENDNNLKESIITTSDNNLEKQVLSTGDKNLDIPKLSTNSDINMDRVNNLKFALKTSPQCISCPYCNYQDFTNVERKCNILNTVFCVFTAGIFWSCHQCFRGKDCNCFNATHSCSKCGQEINDYKAC